MVNLKPQERRKPAFNGESTATERPAKPKTIRMTPSGKVMAKELVDEIQDLTTKTITDLQLNLHEALYRPGKPDGKNAGR